MFEIDSIDATEKEATMATNMFTRRELAHRANDGIEVALYWDKVGGLLTLEVYDAKDDTYFELEVPRNRALDAFHHPYAYIAAVESRELTEPLAA